MTSTQRSFGTLPDGREVGAVTLSGGGLSVTVIAWGATLQAVVLDGVDVVLGYDDLAGYLAKPEYFGATVGRFANRIAGGRFTLGGAPYQTPVNDGPNALHGGVSGFDKQLWDIVAVTDNSVTLRHVSCDGEQGYPGTLTVDATYRLGAEVLAIEYRAATDRATICNVTNHAYWNLAGGGTAMDHVVSIAAEHFTPVDATSIPTGELRPVAGTAFDFRAPKPVGDRVRDGSDEQLRIGRGYDHNWAIGTAPTPDLHLMATAIEPISGRSFELWSNQPGLQFYSGNFLDGTVTGKADRIYRAGDALVFEPQLFPDTPNQPGFGSARLGVGEMYRNVVEYQFGLGD